MNKWDEAKAAVMDRAGKPCKYELALDMSPEADDTRLLAAHLAAEFDAVMAADVGVELDDQSRATLAWYRVAERAKELRA